jgi:hypothetical protein
MCQQAVCGCCVVQNVLLILLLVKGADVPVHCRNPAYAAPAVIRGRQSRVGLEGEYFRLEYHHQH